MATEHNTTRPAHDRLHDALHEALRELETHDFPNDARTDELAKRAGSLLSDLDQVLGDDKPSTGDELHAAVQALAALPSLLKPYTVTGTTLRLPNDLAEKLPNLRELGEVLNSVHYEGVNYGEDEEPPESREPAMDRARADAQQAVYRIRNLIAAAIVCNDGDDSRIEAVLGAAAKQLDALATDLDSVNFGVQQ